MSPCILPLDTSYITIKICITVTARWGEVKWKYEESGIIHVKNMKREEGETRG